MEHFNYYNYHTEVEEFFVSKRGAPMLLSPLDWSLVESWRTMGIPLHVVLRSINKCFESYKVDSSRGKRVNTIFYCHQEVLASFKDYVESQVGGSASNDTTTNNNKKEANSNFSKQQIIGYITECCEELEQARLSATQQGYETLGETLNRAIDRLVELTQRLENTSFIDTEKLETDLTVLEEIIYQNLRQNIPIQELKEIEKEAVNQLRLHKKNMEEKVYKQTLESFMAKRLREKFFIPRLSLFYMIY